MGQKPTRKGNQRTTLRDEEISTRRISRRRILGSLSLIGAGTLAAWPRRVGAQEWVPQTECFGVECQPGYNPQGTYGPPAGHGGNQGLPWEDTYGEGGGQAGRCLAQTGLTDTDWGQFQDAAGCGRFGTGQGGVQRTGLTDCDTGGNADPGGYGRGYNRPTGLTDTDFGAVQDYGGCGRRGW